MNITGDQYLVKKINKSLILELIRQNSSITKPQIVNSSGLNKGTVSRLVNELAESNLIYEAGYGVSSGGRIPTMYSLNHMAGFALGIDLRMDLLTAVLSDLNGSIILREEKPLKNMEVDYIYQQLVESISSLINKAPKSDFGITGIGIGFPGIVDENGVILIAPSLDWKNVPLRSMLQKEFDIPIRIDNEARVGLIGEKQFGNIEKSSNVIFVSIGKSIGSGMIVNNNIYMGNAGLAGEAGHLTIETDGKKCVCGNNGCWQEYASIKALLNNISMLKSTKEFDNEKIDLKLISGLAQKGNESIIKEINRTGTYIGVGLTNLINLFNPEKVIIGGKIIEIKDYLYPSIMKTIEERGLPYHTKEIEVNFTKLGGDSTLKGALSLVLSHFFKSTRIA